MVNFIYYDRYNYIALNYLKMELTEGKNENKSIGKFIYSAYDGRFCIICCRSR